MNYKLSICIPTYNRSDYLPTALESVLSQISDEVEITICDNGSEDATKELVRSYLEKYPSIKYHRFEKNVGPDRCFLKAVEIATGEFCWFLGDDDAIERGSIQIVLDTLKQNPQLSGLSVNRKIIDKSFENELPYEPIHPNLNKTKFYQNREDTIHDLFTYFGYMSGQIVRKELWIGAIKATKDIEQYFNAYSILFLVVKIIMKNSNWAYLDSAFVKYRISNDSFERELGFYKRFLLDAVGYESLAKGLFSYLSRIYRNSLDQICKTHIKARVISLRNNKSVKYFSLKALFVLLPRYWMVKSFWIENLPLLLIPDFLYPPLRFIYRLFKYRSLSRARIVS